MELDLAKIKKFFGLPQRDGTPGRPVEAKEMSAFWRSLEDEEKAAFKNVELDPYWEKQLLAAA